MYRINTASLVRNKLFICREWHVQPSEIDKMPYYEYEQILEEINIVQKEQEKEKKEQEKQYGGMNNMNPKTMMNSMRNSMPSFNTNSFKMPTLSMPKF